ncbi:MAG: hypothetical protein Q4C91_13665 [Eubacteriales bacterium]|nr:hypothetical protein [Eubacteriales bacterium]
MAVIGAVIGIGVVGIAAYDNHSDYSDYNNYSNYSNYSDAAERTRRRRERKEKEIETQKQNINTYKTESVNDYLKSISLRRQSGVDVNVLEVKKDGNTKLEEKVKLDARMESTALVSEIDELDQVIKKIDRILEEEK